MRVLRTLIVDDEPLARDRLRGMLESSPMVEIVGECDNGADAVATIRLAVPDLVFLDMSMPGCDGLEVIDRLPKEKRPAIIFATAHEQFALDAFNVAAVDYLLKPFDRERLQSALNRAREQLHARSPDAPGPVTEIAALPPRNDRIAVRADGRIVFLRADEIMWVEAADNYVVLHLAKGRLMVRETLGAIEARLGTISFTRVNRSVLVQLDQIRELRPSLNGDYSVVLRDGTVLPLSRSLRGQLDKFVTGGA